MAKQRGQLSMHVELLHYNASESIVTPDDDTERTPLIDTTVDLQVGDREPLEILKATLFVESWLHHCE